MKLTFITTYVCIIFTLFKLYNTQGEFLRLNQPQEHIIIPLINSFEVEYNPFVAPSIKKYRKDLVKYLKKDKDLKFKMKQDEELNAEVDKRK